MDFSSSIPSYDEPFDDVQIGLRLPKPETRKPKAALGEGEQYLLPLPHTATEQYAIDWDAPKQEVPAPRRIAGLASKLWEVAAGPVKKGRDASEQLMERLSALQKIAKQVKSDRFTKDNAAPSEADIKAVKTLEHLMEANHHKKTKGRTRNMREFLRDLRSDMREARTQSVLAREAATKPVSETIQREFKQLSQPLLNNMITNGHGIRMLHRGKAPLSIRRAGLYTELYHIIHDENEPTAACRWRNARKLCARIADENFPAIEEPNLQLLPINTRHDDVPELHTHHMNHVVQAALESCIQLNLKVPQRLQLLEKMLDDLQPVAEHLTQRTVAQGHSLRIRVPDKYAAREQQKRFWHRVAKVGTTIVGVGSLMSIPFVNKHINTPPAPTSVGVTNTPPVSPQEYERILERRLGLDQFFPVPAPTPSTESSPRSGSNYRSSVPSVRVTPYREPTAPEIRAATDRDLAEMDHRANVNARRYQDQARPPQDTHAETVTAQPSGDPGLQR